MDGLHAVFFDLHVFVAALLHSGQKTRWAPGGPGAHRNVGNGR